MGIQAPTGFRQRHGGYVITTARNFSWQYICHYRNARMKMQRLLSRPRRFANSLLATIALLGPIPAVAVTYNSQQVDMVRPGGDRPCMLFTLVGVAQSDPALGGSVWFAIPQSTPGYKDIVAALLLAKGVGRGVDVITTGTIPPECGHPGVSVIVLR